MKCLRALVHINHLLKKSTTASRHCWCFHDDHESLHLSASQVSLINNHYVKMKHVKCILFVIHSDIQNILFPKVNWKCEEVISGVMEVKKEWIRNIFWGQQQHRCLVKTKTIITVKHSRGSVMVLVQMFDGKSHVWKIQILQEMEHSAGC